MRATTDFRSSARLINVRNATTANHRRLHAPWPTPGLRSTDDKHRILIAYPLLAVNCGGALNQDCARDHSREG